MLFRKKRFLLKNVPGCIDIYKDKKCTKFITRYTYYWFINEVFLKDGFNYIPLSDRGVLYDKN